MCKYKLNLSRRTESKSPECSHSNINRYSLRKFAIIESFSTLLRPRLDGTSFWLLSKEAPTFLRVFPLMTWPLGPQWSKMPADFLILTTSVLIIIQEIFQFRRNIKHGDSLAKQLCYPDLISGRSRLLSFIPSIRLPVSWL